jgi:type VI secretion system protein VasD
MRFPILRALPAVAVLCCSSPPPPAAPPPAPPACVPPRPQITIAASERANAGPDGKGLPVQVRLYQLKSEAKLVNPFFADIWKNDAATLAEDLLNVREVTVFPGQSQQFPLDQLPDARVLSAVALFRVPQGRDWLVNYDLAQPKPQGPCPPPEPRISIWLDRMKIQDGEGQVGAGGGDAPAQAGSSPQRGEAAPGKGN